MKVKKDETRINFIELLKGSSISLLLKVLGMLFGYLTMLFITNFYGAEEWGIFSLCFTVLSISILLPKFGFDSSLVRIIAALNIFNDNKEIVRVVLKSLTISMIISFIIIIVINLFSDYLAFNILKKEEMRPYIMLISIAIPPMVILALINATFQALKKVVLFMLFQTALINIVFLILLIFYQSHSFGNRTFVLYLSSVCVVLVLALIFVLILLKKKSRSIKPILSREVDSYSFKAIVTISLPMLMSNSFSLLMAWSDIIILSFYKTTTDVGIYNSLLKLAALSSIPLIAINSITTPKFVEFFSRKDIAGLKDIVQKSTKLIFLASAPILLVLIIFSKQLLGVLGDEFPVGYLALIYLCISRFINAISGSVGYIMQMTDHQKIFQNTIIVAFINLILNLILIPKFSYNGAAIASSIAMVFWNLALVFIIKKKLGFWTIFNPFIIKQT